MTLGVTALTLDRHVILRMVEKDRRKIHYHHDRHYFLLLFSSTVSIHSSSTEYATLVNKYDRLISSIVVTDMDFDQLDSFLQLQMKKKCTVYGYSI